MPLKLNRYKPLLLFYLVIIYVSLQFIWWSWLLVRLNREVYRQQAEIVSLKSGDPVKIAEAEKSLQKTLHKKWWMIAGEGAVFMLLLLAGIIKTRNAFKKEAALARQQNNFLLSVTHELKSPLSSNKLYLQTLLKHDLPAEKQKEIIGSALNDTERLNKLVDNLLLAARIDSRDMPFQTEITDLSTVTEDAINGLNKALTAHHTIIIKTGPRLLIKSDPAALSSIILNIFENAVKYSPRHSSTTVKTYREGDSAVLQIADEGSGIPAEEKENIFKKFYRVGNEDTRQTKGTGLGLYIVKQLVQKHGGYIEVRDNSPKGAIFEAYFPLAKDE